MLAEIVKKSCGHFRGQVTTLLQRFAVDIGTHRYLGSGFGVRDDCMRERIFIELMSSDRKLKASREGSK